MLNYYLDTLIPLCLEVRLLKILNQPFEGSLGDLLISKLNETYSTFTMITAYAKKSGVSRLSPAIEVFNSRGGNTRAFVGIDQRNTSYEALIQLQQLCHELYIIHSENLSHTFHPKVYIFRKDTTAWVSVGSNNLTSGGLWTNYETSMMHDFDLLNEENEYKKLDDLLAMYSKEDYPCSLRIQSTQDIDRLLEKGYILKEENLGQGFGNGSSSQLQKGLFGSEHFSAPAISPLSGKGGDFNKPETPDDSSSQNPAPNLETPPDANPVSPVQPLAQNEIFWFEMRASTGGSRNILDLSMIGRIVGGTAIGTRYASATPNQMLGGVVFFDIDPNDHAFVKNITIHFEGADYFPSTILFAENNGSWRLQLKGYSPNSNQALSEYGKTRFMNKILLFEKIRTDYFVLNVVDGNQLSNLITRSRVYARNGINPNSKLYGILQ